MILYSNLVINENQFTYWPEQQPGSKKNAMYRIFLSCNEFSNIMCGELSSEICTDVN